MEFRPGIVALRPLGLGDIYGGVLKSVRGNPAATIGLAALTSFAFLLPTTALGAWLAGRSQFDLLGASSASDTVPDGFGLAVLGQYLPSLGQAASGILLAGFLAQVVGQAVLGRTVGMGEVWRATRGRLAPLVGVVLLTGVASLVLLAVAVGVPVALFVVADPQDAAARALGAMGVVLVVLLGVAGVLAVVTRWSLATPAIVLERVGVLTAVRRSWALVGGPLRGPFWRVFGIRLLTALIVGTAAYVIALPLSVLLLLLAVGVSSAGDGPDLFVLQTVVSGIAALITGALTTPFSAGVDALLYVDQRMRLEGLDVRLIQAAQGATEPPWPLTRP
ncbi:hypothetical protein H9L10_02345 [Phycicoccus endophyticus]|uniref:Glycerophosphoryl diester phosphodiesterase membrane domain-containing protein n=1 Tax=Phycicoccus endophyticus TaxID=1690220 RepID=A0A7G9R2W8_9MICO|nr:hypothetical protein [Phycicoccus endophyticus]NHI20419.1 hypothetical protein [Phycicoccus endophyticus]QNN49943.1 hypothetical protein H9L10_02345 [Phycicoccus endophyticus]